MQCAGPLTHRKGTQTVSCDLAHNLGALPHLVGCDRRHDRYEWRHWVQVCWLQPTGLSKPITISTTDLSAGGIGLLCPNMVYPDTLGVVLLVDAQDRTALRYVEVMHCRYLIGSMLHLVGARWVSEPMGMPNMEVEMTPDGPRLAVGQPRSRRDLSRRRRAAGARGATDSGRNAMGRRHEPG